MNRDLQQLIPYIIERLRDKGATLAIAESLTGGNVSRQFALCPGASAVFDGGVVAYSNYMKRRVLNVPQETIRRYTEVSSQCARDMAYGVAKLCGSDIGIATTGFADPHKEAPYNQRAYIAISFRSRYGEEFFDKLIIQEYEKTRERFINLVTHEILSELGQNIDKYLGGM